MASKVLITQGTRPFAQRVGRLLQGRYAVQYGAADEIPNVLLQMGNYTQFAGADTASFEHELLRTCLDHHIEVLIPLGEKEIDLLSPAQPLFAEYGISIWLPHAAHAGALGRIGNPERSLPLVVLDQGVAVAGELHRAQPDTLSGVFAQLPAGGELALCCITV